MRKKVCRYEIKEADKQATFLRWNEESMITFKKNEGRKAGGGLINDFSGKATRFNRQVNLFELNFFMRI